MDRSGSVVVSWYFDMAHIIIDPQSSPPTTTGEADAGMFYYDTEDKKLRFYNGTAWADVSPAAAALTSADLPAGSVLQVISTAKRDIWSSASSHNAFEAITGMSVAIPTSAAANKVLVQYHVNFSHDAGSHAGLALALYRNGSIITDATASALGSSQVAVTNIAMPVEFYASGGASGTASMSYLDTPGSAATHTYALYAFNASGTDYYTYVNRVTNDAYSAYGTRGISTITVTEIAV